MVKLQQWLPELTSRNTRLVALTTDSPAKNQRVAARFGITFPVLTDADGLTLKRLGMWDERWSVAAHGYYLLDGNLNVVSRYSGNWELSDHAKAFFRGKLPAKSPGPPPS